MLTDTGLTHYLANNISNIQQAALTQNKNWRGHETRRRIRFQGWHLGEREEGGGGGLNQDVLLACTILSKGK